MKPIHTLIALIAVSLLPLSSANAQKARIFGRLLERAEGKAALKAASIAGAGALAGYEFKAYQDQQTPVAQIGAGEAIYSVQMDLDSGAHAIHWARWFGYPNITPMLQVEGQGDFLIPNYYPSFKGGVALWTFKIPVIPGNRKINVVLFDNTFDQNALFNQFLRTQFAGYLDVKIANVKAPVLKGVALQAQAGGSFQIMSSDHADLPIIQPSQLCTYTVDCPCGWWPFYSTLSTWDTEGEIKDESGNLVGHIRMSQVVKN